MNVPLRRRHLCLLVGTLALLPFCSGLAGATTIVVPDQVATIGAAIGIAASGDTILVRPGTYTENLVFAGEEVVLISEGGPAVTTIYAAALAPTILIQNGEGRGLVIEGFTITGPADRFSDRRGIEILSGSPTICGNHIRDNVAGLAASGGGGGIYATGGSSPWIEGNTIQRNGACPLGHAKGGGIYLDAAVGLAIPAGIVGNTVIDNETGDEWSLSRAGGGICVETTDPEDCLIAENTVSGNVSGCGGGICANCEVRDNLISENRASGDSALGGGLCLTAGAARRNIVLRNLARSHPTGVYSTETCGGGIFSRGGDLIDNVVAYNKVQAMPFSPGSPGRPESYAGGGGIFFDGDSLCGNSVIRDTLVLDPEIVDGGGSGIVCSTSPAVCITNNLVVECVGFTAGCSGHTTEPIFACNNVWGNVPRNYGSSADPTGLRGNISQDPLLCDPDAGDFTLEANSPCAPEHSPTGCGLIGALPVGCTLYLYVAPDGSAAYPTIQDAIDAADEGMIVKLLDGTFSGPRNRDLDTGGRAITIESLSGNPAACRIDCEGSPQSPHRAFSFQSGEGSGTQIRNITITDGYHPDCGGGINIAAASPVIQGCVITGCATGGSGGGIHCTSGGVLLSGCRLTDNSAAHGGGGMLISGATAQIEECTISGCSASAFGGGILCPDGQVVMAGCRLMHNQADGGGGGVAVDGGAAAATVSSCTFYANSAGGAMGGGAQATGGATLVLENSIVAFGPGGCAVYGDGGGPAPDLSCCDLFDNAGGDWTGVIAGQLGVGGNISEDPLFCDAVVGDFTLTSESPCAPEHNPQCGLIGAMPVGCEPQFLVRPDGTGLFPTIQAAIDAAWEGVTILLADGVYSGDGNRDVDFRGKPVTVRSVSHNPLACIIDCQGSAQQLHRGFAFQTGETSESVLQGVEIKGGYQSYGGAIHCFGTSPRIVDCVMTGNVATIQGGGFYAYHYAEPILEGCTLVANQAYLGAGAAARQYSSITLENCIVASNLIGDAVHCYQESEASASCCDIWNNTGGDYVGCIAAYAGVDGNLCVDPQFCNPESGDLRLYDVSPCAAENNVPCGQIGALGIGCGGTAAVEAPDLRLPGGRLIAWAAPNPTAAAVEISYRVPTELEGTRVQVAILDPAGRLVRMLVDGPHAAGIFHADWDRRDAAGQPAAAGSYFYRIRGGDAEHSGRLILLR